MTGWMAATAIAVTIGAAAAPGRYGEGQTTVQNTEEFAWLAPELGQKLSVLRMSGSQIGVTIRDLTQDDLKGKTASTGVFVEDVASDGPAAKAGFRAGDVVVEFDGERVRGARQFTRLVQETAAGRPVEAILLRDGQRVTLSVEPREPGSFRMGAMKPAPRVALPREGHFELFPNVEGLLGTARLGVSVSDLSPQLAEYFGAKDGVLVTSVSDDSVGSKIGLRAGDVITSIDGGAVNTGADLRRRMQRLESGDEFTLGIIRDKKPQSLKGKLDPATPRRPATRTIL